MSSLLTTICELCGEPLPEGEEMFKYHGYSGPCPKPLTASLAKPKSWTDFTTSTPNPDSGWVDELRDFLSGQQDAEYSTDSPSPQPNQAMRLLVRLNELWPEARK